MILKSNGEFTWLEFEIFQPFSSLKHGVFTHLKPSSPILEQHHDFNVPSGNPVKDQQIIQGISALFDNLEVIYSKQLHEDNVMVIHAHNLKKSKACDSLVTNNKGCLLMIKHADCQAALFFDPIKNLIANVHCGWKGTNLNIYRTTIERMRRNYGCNPQNILVGISPSLGPCHAEFTHYQKELIPSLHAYKLADNRFNFWEIARDQLIESGILDQNIEIAQMCTYEQEEYFYSYRRNKTSQRNASFIGLKE